MQIDGLDDAAAAGAVAAAQQTATCLHQPAAGAGAGVRAASSSLQDLTFDSLPTDVAEKIFAHLAPADLKYARLVSR